MKQFVTTVGFIFACAVIVKSVPVIDDKAKISPEIKCRQPYVFGDSPSVISYWSYDASRGRCVAQSGYARNDNKFSTKQECESACTGIKDGPFKVSDNNESEEIRIKAFERVDEVDHVDIDM